jgi:hypothetical protein
VDRHVDKDSAAVERARQVGGSLWMMKEISELERHLRPVDAQTGLWAELLKDFLPSDTAPLQARAAAAMRGTQACQCGVRQGSPVRW